MARKVVRPPYVSAWGSRYIASRLLRNTTTLKSFVLGVVCILMALSAQADPFTFVTAEAQLGDGMYAMLNRYGLPLNTCYQDQFKTLNSLSAKHDLHVGRTYKLPILQYDYDARSIRSTLGIKDMDLAKEIQAYNRTRETVGQQAGPYEQSKVLWVPYCMLFSDEQAFPENEIILVQEEEIVLENDPGALSAPSENTKVIETRNVSSGYAIFGEKYANVKRKDTALQGKIFYLVSGHGGPDPGAIGSKNDHALCEDEYAYDVVLRLARNIIEHGGVPYVIVRDEDDGIRDDEYLECDRDERVWGDKKIPLDQRDRLKQRSKAINVLAKAQKKKGITEQYCIVVHVDSRHQETQTDLFFYHQRNDERSKELTERLRKTMEENYRRNGRSREYQGAVLTRDLHMLREVDVPTVYIELGNIQHKFDQKRVLQASNRQALANWWTEGLIDAL